MSTHDGLVLLAIYVGVIGVGALIEYVEHRVKRAIRRRKRSWKTSLFFIKNTWQILNLWYNKSIKRKGINQMLFIVSVNYYNYKADDNNRYRYEVSVAGQENAYALGQKFMDADNVLSVDIIDAMTGEVIESWKD